MVQSTIKPGASHQTDVPRQIMQGVVGGFIATLPMTVFLEIFQPRLPRGQRYALPPSQITRRFVERKILRRNVDKPQHIMLTLAAHFGYGAALGGLYGLLPKESSQETPGSSLVKGNLFGLGVWAISYLGLIPGLKILPPATEMPARRNVLMVLAHLLWGSVLAFYLTGRTRLPSPDDLNRS